MEKITKILKSKIHACWKNGWFVDNIAHICETDPDTVVKVLKDKGIKDIR